MLHVEDHYHELFPNVRHGAVRTGDDAAGWSSGRRAADLARLNLGDLANDPYVDAADQRERVSLATRASAL